VVQIQIAGVTRNAVELDFDVAAEPGADYRLADDGRIRLRATVTFCLPRAGRRREAAAQRA